MDRPSSEILRFGDFELDVAAYELSYHGRPIRLERQPMDLLMLLVTRRRQLVLRSEIVKRLWGERVFLDADQGVNTAIRKIRQALRHSGAASTFVETVAGKGYRFTAPVEVLATPRSPSSPIRLAVLPFETLGLAPEREYLGDGLTEETIASLGQIDPEQLSVIGRTSTMAYRKTDKSISAIGAELGVDYLVEALVRGENDRLLITAKLVRVDDQVQVWSASYDRAGGSILGIQQELSTAIAEQIRLRLSPERLTALGRRQTRNSDAYDLYLRGRRLWNQLTPATTRSAVEYFIRATRLDPDYALAWAGIAEAYASSPINGDAPPAEASARARDAAAQAIRADAGLAQVQHTLGQVKFFLDWDWPAAEAAFRRALAVDGSFAFAQSMLGHVLSQMGRPDEALRAVRRAREIEPLSALDHAMSSQVAFQARDYSAALDHARQAVAIDPEFWVGYMMKGQAHEQLGDADAALEALAAAGRLSGGNSKPISLRGYVLGRQRKLREAREVLGVFEGASQHRFVPPYAVALVQAGMDEPDAAFMWLHRAFLARDVHLVFLTVDPKWDRYRSDERFQLLLERCDFMGRSAHSPSLSSDSAER